MSFRWPVKDRPQNILRMVKSSLGGGCNHENLGPMSSGMRFLSRRVAEAGILFLCVFNCFGVTVFNRVWLTQFWLKLARLFLLLLFVFYSCALSQRVAALLARAGALLAVCALRCWVDIRDALSLL